MERHQPDRIVTFRTRRFLTPFGGNWESSTGNETDDERIRKLIHCYFDIEQISLSVDAKILENYLVKKGAIESERRRKSTEDEF